MKALSDIPCHVGSITQGLTRFNFRPYRMPILPDVLQPNLNIVFCGTAPGTVSAQRGAYYANAGFVLPSPSGLARSHWSIGPWHELWLL